MQSGILSAFLIALTLVVCIIISQKKAVSAEHLVQANTGKEFVFNGESAADTLGRLLANQMAANQQQEQSHTISNKKRNSLNTGSVNSQNNNQFPIIEQEAKQKSIFKKKIYKLVDELLSENESNNNNDQSYKKREEEKSQLYKPDLYKKKKLLYQNNGDKMMILLKEKPSSNNNNNNNLNLYDNQQQQASGSVNTADNNKMDNNPLMMVINHKPSMFPLANNNAWEDEQRKDGSSLNVGSQFNQQVASSLIAKNNNNKQHDRRILDDGFGIRRESAFSTNNHLGIKGVPKYGSEEEY